MDGLTLLARARDAGLTVWTVGGRLHVRGLPGLEPLARRLLKAKAEVLAALAENRGFRAPPSGACPACQGSYFWRHVHGGPYVCGRCHPAPPPRLRAEEVVVVESLPPEMMALFEQHGWSRSDFSGEEGD